MRRPLLALAVGSLLAVTACGTARNPAVSAVPSAGAGAPSAVAVPTELAETKAVCEAIGQVYTANMGPFAQAVSELAAVRQRSGDAGQLQGQAQERLSEFATAIRGATRDSGVREAQAAGERTAKLLEAKSDDAAFFRKIQTGKDAEQVIGSTLKEWLKPVTSYCS
ncbi:MAG TPA: hypothetical protein VFH03_00040 [Actinoplanes sp.]|nr:hypothetical protein [Actinoplanes sp.]